MFHIHGLQNHHIPPLFPALPPPKPAAVKKQFPTCSTKLVAGRPGSAHAHSKEHLHLDKPRGSIISPRNYWPGFQVELGPGPFPARAQHLPRQMPAETRAGTWHLQYPLRYKRLFVRRAAASLIYSARLSAATAPLFATDPLCGLSTFSRGLCEQSSQENKP